MSNEWGYGNDDNAGLDSDNEMTGPKALRDAYEAMKAQNKQLQEGLASIQNDLRAQKVSSVFESLGVPEAAKVYQGEPDPEKAREWVNSMRSVFGSGDTQGSAPLVADSAPAAPALSGDQQAQLQRMTEAGQGGVPMGSMDAAFAAVGDATNLQALIAGFQNATRTN